MMFKRSASSCASVHVVKVGRIVLPVVVVSLSARFLAILRTDPAVISDCIGQFYLCEDVGPIVEKL
jgi:hypothetical protein